MTDVYNTIDTASRQQVEQLAAILELRAADPQQRAMLRAYLERIDFPARARVVEVGCGTGPVARVLAQIPDVGAVIGIDPSPVLLGRARQLAANQCKLTFRESSAEALPLTDASQDVVVFHTSLCHLTDPAAALHEAFRVLVPGGWLAVFDGDYASTTFGTDDLDPLQLCAASFRRAFIHDSWLARRAPGLAEGAGFTVRDFRTFSYSETRPDYLLSVVDRGAEALAEEGVIGRELAAAMKGEARQRTRKGRFFGQIGYAALIARKPASEG
ncbi:hypothetical protein JCM30471_25430 [Desulfuromonas carbonis]|uniref:methyltransferase domain-containing protein n=1 Tax=Desulfuromonas sp. DDH964 TaxID=1823759 RepID=UPI00078E532A|nr:methyltransferase domain-containing protein [Desulfuromonas sp. DDH964]AMV70550.1 menaquinone biosynthesis methyltransferase [Desulfuromonas sp. DDH964]